MPRRLALLALLPFLATACADRTSVPVAPSTPTAPTTTFIPPPQKPIPDRPPALPANSIAVCISITTAPDSADPSPLQAGWLEVHMDDTLARAEVRPGDTPRHAMETLARVLLDDGWTLHLEPGPTPDLYLYLPPGPINLSTRTSSTVPGLGIGWSLGAPPLR